MSQRINGERMVTQLSSSIKEVHQDKRSFCIIRNISPKGTFLTSKLELRIGDIVECIISFDEDNIDFVGIVRRKVEQVSAYNGYGIEITQISYNNSKTLDEFIKKGYVPDFED